MSGRTPEPWRGASPGRPLDTLLDLDDDPLHASPELIELVKAAKHDRDALTARVAEMEGALRGLFDNCAMIHKHWGEDSNAKEANSAIAHARRVLDGENECDTGPCTAGLMPGEACEVCGKVAGDD